MAEPQDTQPDTPAGNLDARIEALERYLATQQPQTPTAQTQVSGALPASIDFAGGTIIHIPHVGSFAVPSASTARASAAVIALVVLGAVFLLARRYLHARE